MNDFLLILQMKQGNEKAFDKFVRKYYAGILSYCRYHCMNQAEAEDLTQETFLRFMENIASYQHIGKAKNYSLVVLGCLGSQGGNVMIQTGFWHWKSFYNITYMQLYLLTVVAGYIGTVFCLFLSMLVSAKTHTAVVAVTIPFAVDINADTSKCSRDDVYNWLLENSYKYGFIQRYPSGKTSITGVANEPWHYRYVGKKAAEEIHQSGMCLEEYVENLK